jgi:hypothetical protein
VQPSLILSCSHICSIHGPGFPLNAYHRTSGAPYFYWLAMGQSRDAFVPQSCSRSRSPRSRVRPVKVTRLASGRGRGLGKGNGLAGH